MVGADALTTMESALDGALQRMSGRAPTVAVVFLAGATGDAADDALLAAARRLPQAMVIGSTVDEVISPGEVTANGISASVWLAALPNATVRSFHLEVIRTRDSLAVVGMPPRRDDDSCVVMLADPWSFPAEGFVDSSTAALEELPIVGGLVGGPTAADVRMLVDGRIVRRGAIGLCLGGEVAAQVGVAHASRPVGPPMTITASEGEAVLELAGRPATARIDDLLGELSGEEQALASCGLLLGIVLDEYSDDHGIGDFAAQSVLGSDPASGAIWLAEHVPVGTTVRLHIVDPVAAKADLDAAVVGLAAGSEVEGLLLFSGAPRGGALGTPGADLAAAQALTSAVGVAGMATIGGIGPVLGSNRLLGFASSVLLVGQSVPDRVLTA
jgi:small ligand-binding sensory domain FIST